jgi:hypothetical protein
MEIATIITALAALITAITSFFMVLELKKQRTALSKPILKLLSGYYEAFYSENSWKWNRETNRVPKLSIFNFGSGPAINILITWEIEIEKLIKTIKYFDPYNQLKIELKENVFYCDNSIHLIKKQKVHKIEALPVYQSGESTTLKIPLFYVVAFEKFIELAFINRPTQTNNKVDLFECPDFPPLRAIVCFEDINGEKFKQLFILNLHVYSITSDDETKGSKVSGTIEIIEEDI